MRTRPPLPAFAPSGLVLLTALVLLAYTGAAAAQTPFVPYFGKNKIHYDTFEWHIYTTDHFEIYYYPEMEQHLARIALSPEEEKKLSAQLNNILGYIEKLKEVDVSNVEPTAHAFPLVNVTRR